MAPGLQAKVDANVLDRRRRDLHKLDRRNSVFQGPEVFATFGLAAGLDA